jgi:hypothetical protein
MQSLPTDRGDERFRLGCSSESEVGAADVLGPAPRYGVRSTFRGSARYRGWRRRNLGRELPNGLGRQA